MGQPITRQDLREPPKISEPSEENRVESFKELRELNVVVLQQMQRQNDTMLEANERFLKHLEARDEKLEESMKNLRQENRDLYVRSHRLSLSLSVFGS